MYSPTDKRENKPAERKGRHHRHLAPVVVALCPGKGHSHYTLESVKLNENCRSLSLAMDSSIVRSSSRCFCTSSSSFTLEILSKTYSRFAASSFFSSSYCCCSRRRRSSCSFARCSRWARKYASSSPSNSGHLFRHQAKSNIERK